MVGTDIILYIHIAYVVELDCDTDVPYLRLLLVTVGERLGEKKYKINSTPPHICT